MKKLRFRDIKKLAQAHRLYLFLIFAMLMQRLVEQVLSTGGELPATRHMCAGGLLKPTQAASCAAPGSLSEAPTNTSS